ncbi:D-alanyl-D-alanine carboxypeptidase [Chitinophaga horti]|uniref:D-alanyl-D-alanine carboxypeptidase n=1 Tax=Chitinophaga horti TaxID=2920382 RepID=A0ABY6IZP0_9BACT|nr:D-alanyl-D-alanine carboxypeptidase [Chitinophaga horti]UYQ92884.1 D-alanyl-D-alanine carboxypeptidase [Chitinophaga horti]
MSFRFYLPAILLTFNIINLHAQTKQMQSWANEMLQSPALKNAHTGVAIYDPATGKYLYQYQPDKFFVPASNTKILTLFTGLSFLGDSLPSIRYAENDTAVFIQGMGDPSFLYPDFTYQPAFDYLAKTNKRIILLPAVNENERYGPGWGWGDYADYYQPERNEFPLYGNVAWINYDKRGYSVHPSYFHHPEYFSLQPTPNAGAPVAGREERRNFFYLNYRPGDTSRLEGEVPYITGQLKDIALRLQDTLAKPVAIGDTWPKGVAVRTLYSQPTDSLLQPMMHRSDNFFAEQILMMVSAKLHDTISSRRVIDDILSTSLKDLPDTPQWVDGSGLSRFDLFTPRDFTMILEKMYKAYPKERLFPLFASGGKGTLRAYFREHPGTVFAKTGTLNGVVALSGYLLTAKGKTLIFSILVNNHHNTSTNVRRATEKFLMNVRANY